MKIPALRELFHCLHVEDDIHLHILVWEKTLKSINRTLYNLNYQQHMENLKSDLPKSPGLFRRLLYGCIFVMAAMAAFAQSKDVAGIVLDQAGESVIGASVLVKGTQNGTMSDLNGRFILKDVPGDAVLQVSFIGFKTVDVAVKGQTEIKVVIREDTEMLDEVVVIGYGAVKKSTLTSAVATLSAKGIENRPLAPAGRSPHGPAGGFLFLSHSAWRRQMSTCFS